MTNDSPKPGADAASSAPRDGQAPLPDGGKGSGADGGGTNGDAAPPPPMRGPAPAQAGLAFPFPQNRQSAHCVYPTAYDNAAAQAAYTRWKTDMVTSDGANGHLRVQRTSSDSIDTCRPLGSTVSEGIAYGMLLAVYMGDQSTFDQLWLYEQQNLDMNGLMNWAPTGPSGPTSGCTEGATDADEDMGLALVMASKQWGGQGALGKAYSDFAFSQIRAIWDSEIFMSKWVKGGDSTYFDNQQLENISYFAPAYYRIFAQIDPPMSGITDNWEGAIDQAYATLNDSLDGNGNSSNGLVPAWCNDSSGSSCTPGPMGQPGNYQYDSCRTPFRIGLDWCWFGDARAQAYVAKTSSFFSGVGVANVVDGYALDGTAQAANPGKQSAAFIGPAGVGAMSAAQYQPFLDGAYTAVAGGNLLAGGNYYEESWMALSLLMMTGNFLDYTSIH